MHLRDIVAVTHQSNLVALVKSDAARLTAPDIARGNFSALTNAGVDSVLLVRVLNQGFVMRKGFNPAMPVDIQLGIDVVRVKDGERLFTQTLRYRGERRQFTKWGANKAKLFRAELGRAQVTFAAAIYEGLAGDEPAMSP